MGTPADRVLVVFISDQFLYSLWLGINARSISGRDLSEKGVRWKREKEEVKKREEWRLEKEGIKVKNKEKP